MSFSLTSNAPEQGAQTATHQGMPHQGFHGPSNGDGHTCNALGALLKNQECTAQSLQIRA